MLVMFGVFAVLFYIDGSTGYRKKNESFYLRKAFQTANDEFSKMNSSGSLTPEAWKSHAEKQTVEFPEDRSILPASLELPMPWPAILHDFERMKPLQWNILWREYSKERGPQRLRGRALRRPENQGTVDRFRDLRGPRRGRGVFPAAHGQPLDFRG